MDQIMVTTNGTLTTSIGLCAKDASVQVIKDFLSLFYIMSPMETTKDNPYDVPDYEVTLTPVVGILVLLEQLIRYFQRKDLSRFQDYIINAGSAIIFTLMRVFLLTTSVTIFTLIYENYRLLDLPLHSVWTWIISLLLVEFTYYWTHRALHEFNILWAAHQFHHMAEDVNITTTIRDSVVDLFIYAVFPLPLAIFVPPPILLVHVQFSLIYQVWLHNSVIGNLGFLEYVINTPRQHRVHHGKNPYCIDKNYGALIMIWDRMFGTHQTEKESIVFGVVSPTPETYDSMILQFGYYRDVWHKFQTVDGLGNKLSALFKGPGWMPGKPRLGDIKDVPEPDRTLPKYSWDPYIPMWKKCYVAIHGIVIVLGFYILAEHPYIRFSPEKGLLAILYIIYILTSFGAIFDNRSWTAPLEITRCLAYFLFDYFLIESVNWKVGPAQYTMVQVLMWSIRLLHIISIVVWCVYSCRQCSAHNKSVAEDTTQYTIVDKSGGGGGKDVESETSSVLQQNSIKVMAIIAFLMLTSIPFGIAFMVRLNSCIKMFNDFYYLIF
ncbi:alkylglycerol monooxygenase-like [Oppia nitens]|uniref:alkylglycerol monooxygenase-like n=1 Tax=Oppia nitens TaxID=1686743 RepID=UPI0023DA3800|nr:alkylglycerol monooxygenase-like [Oppia nitens]